MHKVLMALLGALLVALLAGTPPAPEAEAAGIASGMAGAAQHQTMAQPVLVWRDCQRIARCSGCKPVYRCRSCTYQRQCPRRGPCQWADICVWGPYLPLAPRGVPIR
jgi:hypothetical protein